MAARLHISRAMTKKPVDHRPGPLPDIRIKGTSVIYEFDIATTRDDSRLIIRCDANGAVWVSLGHARNE